MKRTLVLLCWAGLFSACRENKVAEPECQPATTVKANSVCSTTQPKLTLTALNYKLTADAALAFCNRNFKKLNHASQVTVDLDADGIQEAIGKLDNDKPKIS